MTQTDITPRNRHERIRKRAWKQLPNVPRYTKLVALAMEAHTIKDAP